MSIFAWFVIGFFVGVIISGLIYLLTVDKYWIGNLREDRSIPEEPYYFMEIVNGRYERLKTNRFALLRIIRQNYMDKGGEADEGKA